MSTSSASSASSVAVVYVKTLAGALLSIDVEEDMPPCAFPLRVHALLEEPRPPVAFLRFLKASAIQTDENKYASEEDDKESNAMDCSSTDAHFFPLSFEDGDLFFLLVEDPQVHVQFQWRDYAVMNKTGENMMYIVMKVQDAKGYELLQEAFYVKYTTYEYEDEETGERTVERHCENVVYGENQTFVVFNLSARVRDETQRPWRNIVCHADAVPHTSPAFLAQRYFRSEWVPYLTEQIQMAWDDY